MERGKSICDWIFFHANIVFDEYVLYVEIKTFALSGYDWMRMAAKKKHNGVCGE